MSYSLKKHLIINAAFTTKLDEFAKNKVILVTPCGIISGTLISDTFEDTNVKIVSALFKKISNEWISDNGEPQGNDGFISLVDVTINNNGSKTNLPHLNVFFDQIIGVSLLSF